MLRYATVVALTIGALLFAREIPAGAQDSSSTTICKSTSTTDSLVAATITTNETAFSQTCTIPANFLISPRFLRVSVGLNEVVSGGPPTMTARLRLGGIGGTIVYLSAATAGNASATAGVGAIFMIGATAAAGAAANTVTAVVAPERNGGTFSRNFTAQPVAIATNASQVLTLTLQYGANTAGNTTTLTYMVVEALY